MQRNFIHIQPSVVFRSLCDLLSAFLPLICENTLCIPTIKVKCTVPNLSGKVKFLVFGKVACLYQTLGGIMENMNQASAVQY
jgi:hypothetical protein